MSDSLRTHGPQHTRLPCPSPTPRAYSNSCPSIDNAIQPSHPPSIRVFPNKSVLHIWWPKYWSFSFNIIPSNEHSVLISFRMDWLDLLAVQGPLKSLFNITVQKHQSLVLSFLYSPTLTSVHDCWKNRSFD